MQNETTENYLKAIYRLSEGNTCMVTNKQLSDRLNVIPATVTEAVKRLAELRLVVYEKSYGTRLTAQGVKIAVSIVRRHRIWETFLVKQLHFGWDEVHDIAEELEHVKNDKLINRLSEVLGHPSFDPHGDPIPDEKGRFRKQSFTRLTGVRPGKTYRIAAVTEDDSAFLQYLNKREMNIGTTVKVKAIEPYDQTITALINGKKETVISQKVAESILVS